MSSGGPQARRARAHTRAGVLTDEDVSLRRRRPRTERPRGERREQRCERQHNATRRHLVPRVAESDRRWGRPERLWAAPGRHSARECHQGGLKQQQPRVSKTRLTAAWHACARRHRVSLRGRCRCVVAAPRLAPPARPRAARRQLTRRARSARARQRRQRAAEPVVGAAAGARRLWRPGCHQPVLQREPAQPHGGADGGESRAFAAGGRALATRSHPRATHSRRLRASPPRARRRLSWARPAPAQPPCARALWRWTALCTPSSFLRLRTVRTRASPAGVCAR